MINLQYGKDKSLNKKETKMTIDTNLITETINIIRAFVFIFAFAFIIADITEPHKIKSFKLILLFDCFYLITAVIVDCFLQLIILTITSTQQLI